MGRVESDRDALSPLTELDRVAVGDILEIRTVLGERVITAIYECRSGPYLWLELELRQRPGDREVEFMSVEMDDGLVVHYYDRRVDPSEVGYRRGSSVPEHLVVQGERFSKEDSGRMTVGRHGSPAPPVEGQYADYRNGDDLIAIEIFDDVRLAPRDAEIEVWAGRELRPSSVEIYPRSRIDLRPSLLAHATADVVPVRRGVATSTPWLKLALAVLVVLAAVIALLIFL